MGIHLTPTILESAYRFLQNTQPFKAWKLPHADDVSFRVMRTMDYHGAFWVDKKTPVIEISSGMVGYTYSLLEAMAHEMTHLKQWLAKVPVTHSAYWRRSANLVCKYHGFDPKSF